MIMGVAPKKNGEYKYKAMINYTSFRNGGVKKNIETEFVLTVDDGKSGFVSITTLLTFRDLWCPLFLVLKVKEILNKFYNIWF
jgi:hypothetical protein